MGDCTGWIPSLGCRLWNNIPEREEAPGRFCLPVKIGRFKFAKCPKRLGVGGKGFQTKRHQEKYRVLMPSIQRVGRNPI